MTDAIVYDVEIRRPILDRDTVPVEGVEYAAGWGDHEAMGVAVVAVYDLADDRYRLFGADDLEELRALTRSRRWRIGWNSQCFDDKVLRAAGCELHGQSVDLLRLVTRGRSVSGWRLDATAGRNLEESKQSRSASIPIRWQRGEVIQVADHALQDVRLTARLLARIRSTGHLIGPDFDLVPIALPEGL